MGKVMPVAIKIRCELEASFAALGNQKLKLISPILRVGGEVGTFGADAIENIKIADHQAECDVVIEARNWKSMSEDQLTAIVRPRIITALATLLTEAGYDPLPDFLRKEINLAEQVAAGNRP